MLRLGGFSEAGPGWHAGCSSSLVSFQSAIELVAIGFDAVGVGALVVGSLLALATYAAILLRRAPAAGAYGGLRRGLGQSILLGLELLVAGDIIRSIAITPALQNVIVLGIIVLIRTFLSWSLEVELDGRWPWERAEHRRTPDEPE